MLFRLLSLRLSLDGRRFLSTMTVSGGCGIGSGGVGVGVGGVDVDDDDGDADEDDGGVGPSLTAEETDESELGDVSPELAQ